MKYLKPMGDWCLFKDYNGAEHFTDGSRPLMAEINGCDVVIGGFEPSGKDSRVWVGVYFNCGASIEGLTNSKEKGIEIGEQIAEYLNNDATKVVFEQFFRSLDLSEVRAEGFPMTKHEIWAAVNREKTSEFFFNLYERWQDEHEYEDKTDYLSALQKHIPEAYAITKRPFGIKCKGSDGNIHAFIKRKGNAVQLCAKNIN